MIAVAAQHIGTASAAVDAEGLLGRLGCVQLDSIAAVRRSHELVALARGVPLPTAMDLLARRDVAVGFEGWAHAMSFVAIELWPYFAVRRRHIRAKGWSGPAVDEAACREVRRRLAEGQELTSGDLGGPSGLGWGSRSALKIAADWLLWTGEASCVFRRGFTRVYLCTDRAIPGPYRWDEGDDNECLRRLVGAALRALGVGTTDDIADYFRLGQSEEVEKVLHGLGVEQVIVEGWEQPAWLAVGAGANAGPVAQPVALSLFDSLIWYRPRQERLFGRRWLLEAYKAPAKREFGYFGMPILTTGGLAGRVALRCRDGRLVVEAAEWDDSLAERQQLHVAIDRVAEWTGTTVYWQAGVDPL